MSDLTLLDQTALWNDWTNNGQPWTVTLSQASYIARGCQLNITDDREGNPTVEVLAKDGTTEKMISMGVYPAQFSENTGYLSISATTETLTLSQQGTCWNPGTPVNLAFALMFFKDSTSGKIYKQLASLSYVGDPEDAGIMAAEAGDGGDENVEV